MAHLSFAAAHLLLALSIGLSQAQTCFTSDYVIANDGDEYMRLNSTGLYACGGTAICPTLVDSGWLPLIPTSPWTNPGTTFSAAQYRRIGDRIEFRGYLQANAYSDCCTSNGALFTFADNAGLAHAGWEYFIQARSTANSGYPGYLLLQCDGSGCVVGNSGGATGGQAQSGDVVFLGGLGWTI